MCSGSSALLYSLLGSANILKDVVKLSDSILHLKRCKGLRNDETLKQPDQGGCGSSFPEGGQDQVE